jgi:uncharacterized protein
MQRSILDTGPIVALFDKSDHFHKKVFDFFSKGSYIFYSTWPVITEVSFLLEFNVNSQLDFFKWIESGAIQLVDLNIPDISIVSDYMSKYRDVPMDLADAALMCIAEKLDLKDIISLDKDFYIYRKNNGKHLNNLISRLLPDA